MKSLALIVWQEGRYKMERKSLTRYVLSQKLILGINREEWVDIETDISMPAMCQRIREIHQLNPQAKLGLREIVETEIGLC